MSETAKSTPRKNEAAKVEDEKAELVNHFNYYTVLEVDTVF